MNILVPIKLITGCCLAALLTTYAHAQSKEPSPSPKPPNFTIPGDPPPPLSQEILDQKPTEIPPDPPDSTDIREKLLLLHQFLSLPQERLIRIRATIEMIESMTEAERESLRAQLANIENEGKALENEMNHFSEGLPPQDRIIANKFWLSQRESQRKAFRQKWKKLPSHEEQSKFLKKEITAFQERQKILMGQLPKQ